MLLSGTVWYMDIINWLSLIVPFTILCLWLSNMDKYGCYPSWINEPNPWPNIASGFFNSGLGDDIFNQPNMANGKPNLQKTCRRRGPWWSQSRPTVLAAIGGPQGQHQYALNWPSTTGLQKLHRPRHRDHGWDQSLQSCHHWTLPEPDRHRCTKDVQTITTCTGIHGWNVGCRLCCTEGSNSWAVAADSIR